MKIILMGGNGQGWREGMCDVGVHTYAWARRESQMAEAETIHVWEGGMGTAPNGRGQACACGG